MRTPPNKQNSANALKIRHDDPGTALSQTEREMLESRRQAERRRVAVFGQPSRGGAASTSNGNGAETSQSPAPTDPAAQQFEDIFGNVIPFPELPRGPAPVFAEPDEPAADDHGAPTGTDVAPPFAPIPPDERDDRGQVLARYAPVHTPAVAAGIVEQRAPENEQYLDRDVDPETLSIPLVVFPKLNRVIPQSETMYAGWSAYVNAIAPTPAPVVQEKKDVPYVIAGTLQEAPLSKAAQEELRKAGKDAVIGKARSNKHTASFGPAFLLDDDVIDGDVFDREAKLKAVGIAGFIYSSHSYGFGKMGGRVGVCLNRPYAPDEHEPLWDGINHLLGGGFDKADRRWPTPSSRSRHWASRYGRTCFTTGPSSSTTAL
jgi:hypothetical protein